MAGWKVSAVGAQFPHYIFLFLEIGSAQSGACAPGPKGLVSHPEIYIAHHKRWQQGEKICVYFIEIRALKSCSYGLINKRVRGLRSHPCGKH